MRHRDPDLLLVAIATILGSVVVTASLGGPILKVILGLPLALVLPGYALTAALFPATLGLPERLTLTLGTSLAGLAIIGLALNWTPWGLTPPTWTAALATLTLVAVLVAISRRRARAPEPSRSSMGGISPRQWATFGLAAVTLIAALLIVRAGALEPRGAGFTQLWMLPGTQPAGNAVQIGITSNERSTVAYRLELESGSQIVRTWSTIELAPGKSWQTTVYVNPIRPGARTAAILFRLDLPDMPYRQVALAGSR